MRRKIAAVLLSAVLACSMLAGCSGGSPASSTPSSSKPSGSSSSSSSNSSSSSSSSTPSSSSSSANSTSSASSETKELRFDSFTYRVYTYDDTSDTSDMVNIPSYTIFYCFTVTNLNSAKDLEYVHADFSVTDASGKVMKTSWELLPIISAGDTVTFGGSFDIFDAGDSVPANVTYKPNYRYAAATTHNSAKYAKQSDLKVSNVVRTDNSRICYTGTVTNTSDATVGSISVVVFYQKNGKLYAGDSDLPGLSVRTFLPSGESGNFEFYAPCEPADYDSYVIIAYQQW